MEAAIYARVSTERQDLAQTMDSQLAILTAWVRQQGHRLAEAHVYCDRGYSGARLDRPALDRLRDDAQAGLFEVVAILTPDRLARKYAYQALVLDELQRIGCRVVFVQHPVSDDPNDQLLLQIQAAVAEYERAVLGERFRRGKLHKARAGDVISQVPPYGYRYVPKQEGCPGHLVVDEGEAELVRLLFRWLIDERLTIRQLLKRLNAGPWRPRCGRPCWSTSVVHHILSDPVVTGTAYANRYAYLPAAKPRRPDGPRAGAPARTPSSAAAGGSAPAAPSRAPSWKTRSGRTWWVCSTTPGVCWRRSDTRPSSPPRATPRNAPRRSGSPPGSSGWGGRTAACSTPTRRASSPWRSWPTDAGRWPSAGGAWRSNASSTPACAASGPRRRRCSPTSSPSAPGSAAA
jgi:DNA invertase Pin-like site-specific DNA recombinase